MYSYWLFVVAVDAIFCGAKLLRGVVVAVCFPRGVCVVCGFCVRLEKALHDKTYI